MTSHQAPGRCSTKGCGRRTPTPASAQQSRHAEPGSETAARYTRTSMTMPPSTSMFAGAGLIDDHLVSRRA